MLHTEIDRDEIVERYVGGRLTPDERQAFEEHYFACDECFDKVQAMERFAAGIQDLAQRGELAATSRPALVRSAPEWTIWAFSASSLAAVALGVLSGWAYLHRIPALERQLGSATAKLQSPPVNVAQLEPPGSAQPAPEANVPLVMLEASRGAEEATTVVLAARSQQLILWAEIGPIRYRDFSLEVYSASGIRIITINGLTRGPYGALAASLPAAQLQPGTFRVKLRGQSPPPASLVGEYRLQIRRP